MKELLTYIEEQYFSSYDGEWDELLASWLRERVE